MFNSLFLPRVASYVAMLRLDLNPSPRTASSPSSSDGRAKRSNPLVDLIETEKIYVDQLSGIIRVRCSPGHFSCHYSSSIQKVASAWSRTNLPPHELDLMFRGIEGVYKADRSLLSVRPFDLIQPVFTLLTYQTSA